MWKRSDELGAHLKIVDGIAEFVEPQPISAVTFLGVTQPDYSPPTAVLPNGSRLSCGRPARRRKVVGRSPCPARGTTLRFLKAITARRLQALVRLPATLLALSSPVPRRSANAGSAGPTPPRTGIGP